MVHKLKELVEKTSHGFVPTTMKELTEKYQNVLQRTMLDFDDILPLIKEEKIFKEMDADARDFVLEDIHSYWEKKKGY